MQSKIAILGALLVLGGSAARVAADEPGVPAGWPASAPHEPVVFLYASAKLVPDYPPSIEATTVPGAPAPVTLARGEVVETQRLLAVQGYKPGPADGAVGPHTLDAASRYRTKHNMVETATLDRPLLERLRADAGPRMAQRAPRRSSDPFEGFRQAGQRITAWFNSIGR